MVPLRLLDFQQGDQALDLRFEGVPVLAVEARACLAAREDLGPQVQLASEIVVTGEIPSISRLRLELPAVGEEPDDEEYLVSLRILTAENSHTMEVVRQGENFLQTAYGFQRSGGYCILGQHDFDVGTSDGCVTIAPRFVPQTPTRIRASLRAITSEPGASEEARSLVNASPELALAQRAIRWLEAADPLTGPSHASGLVRRTFTSSPLRIRLWMLQKGLHRVQCSGFRDLFAELLASEGVHVRAVDASVVAPRYKDLVGYGHSLTEVVVAQTGGWAIVDPWMAGLVLRDDGGDPLGVDAVRSGVPLAAVHLVPKLDRRLSPDGRSAARTSTFLPDHVDLENPLVIRGTRQPGYRSYFRSVRMGRVVARRRVRVRLGASPSAPLDRR